ncbi:uncharacterized protein LOC124174021 [Ischnura elegans]|uniref:uncharacterized protein LOC124174021 n=1 Tax=Ischnura elegans TaxID=197161 RepID=UPI001ED86EBB|nr:uncharacterized protein LOC124174021 [Ischnura elegans]
MAASGYTKQNCVAGIGTHYFKTLDQSTPCSNMYPIFVTFNGNKAVGFGIQTLGYPLFNKYSRWNEYTLGYPELLKQTPTCLRFSAIYPGVIVTHFYFTQDPSLIKCSE